MYEYLFDFVKRFTELDRTIINKILISVAIIITGIVIRKIILKITWSKVKNVQTRYRIQKTSGYITFSLLLLIVGRVWFEVFQSLATLIGLLSAGIAIALKDIIMDMAGFIFIIVKRPFEVGDRIQIGNFSGDVVDVRVFQFSIMEIGNWVDADQSTGRIIHVPNDRVFTDILANYSKGFYFIWNEISLVITFESNWKKTKHLLSELINNHAEDIDESAKLKVIEASKKYMIFYSKLTPIVYMKVVDHGIKLTMRYLCEPKKRRFTEDKIWSEVLDIIQHNNDIDLAYNTIRVYKENENIDNTVKNGVLNDE